MFFDLKLVLLNWCVELSSDEAKKSHAVELSDQEFKILKALKQNPEVLDQFTSITHKFNQEVEADAIWGCPSEQGLISLADQWVKARYGNRESTKTT